MQLLMNQRFVTEQDVNINGILLANLMPASFIHWSLFPYKGMFCSTQEAATLPTQRPVGDLKEPGLNFKKESEMLNFLNTYRVIF